MKHRLVRAVVLIAVMAALAPGLASAGAPIGGCPPGGWQLAYPRHQPQAADKNGDGWLCLLYLPAGFTFFDNVVPEL